MSARYDYAVMCLARVLYVVDFYLSGDKTGLICFSGPRTSELARVRGRRPVLGQNCLSGLEIGFRQLVAGFLACGRVPGLWPGSR